MPPSPLPPRLRCDRSTVDLWWMDAREPGASEAALEACLASAERTKLAELRHPVVKRHRRFFRARLRQILSLYTGLRPESLQFVLGEHGKPALAHPGDPTFNLSHSGEFGLLGITGAARIGVDLELSSRRTAYLDLADRFFAPMEAAALRALSRTDQRRAFFTGWVRKEAWIKALGTGLSTPLADFRVSLDERGQTERWMLEAGPTGQAENWTFTTPAPLPEPCSLAAVAVEGPEVRLRWREWRDFTPLST